MSLITCREGNLFCPDGIIPIYADLGNTTLNYSFDRRSRSDYVLNKQAGFLLLNGRCFYLVCQ
ncbi:MAG: hypothetical protein ACJ8BW_24245 [Ktedonobacteraceae bacterium]